MTINEKMDGKVMTVILDGRLDTLSSPDLETYLEKYYPIIEKLIFDMEKVEFVSSAGLRVILRAQHMIKGDRNTVVIRGANKIVKAVFEVTGFTNFFTFE